MRALPRIVAETEIGKQVPVVLWRDGKSMIVQASIAELPDDQQQASATPDKKAPPPSVTSELEGLGMRVSPITDDLRGKYSIGADQKGVVITDVMGSPASDRGLKPGDVIVEVQQEAVTTPADVQSRVDRYRKQDRKTVLMLIQSSDGLRWVPLPLATDKKGG